jgi:hypothetical protein
MTNDNDNPGQTAATDAVAEMLELIRLMLEDSPYPVQPHHQPAPGTTAAD